MCMMCSVGYGAAGLVILVSSTGMPIINLASSTDAQKTATLASTSLQELPDALDNVKLPTLTDPAWLTALKVTEQNAAKPISRTVTYSVTTKGVVTASLAEFKQQANATLNDGRGWARLGVAFQEVADGGSFTLVLSEASQLPSFSSGCSADYSCRAGRYVVINQDRWMGATPSWNNGGGSLREYRHMVVNHETGHWLGHDHEFCGGAGQSAPVMQQQSIDLQGCSFNPWPLASEMWSTQLGITR